MNPRAARSAGALLLFAGLFVSSGVSADAPSARHARLLARADSLVAARRVPAAERFLDSLVTSARERGDTGLEMIATVRRSASWLYTRGPAVALPEARRGVAMARAARDSSAWCRALVVVQFAAFDAERLDEAQTAARQILALARRTGDREAETLGSIGLGYAALQQQAYARAATHYRRALASAGAAGIPRHELRARVGLARAEFGAGDLDAARAELHLVIGLAQRLQDLQAESEAWNNLGAYEQQGGEPSLAPRYYERSLALRRRAGLRTTVGVTNLANTQRSLGRYSDAAATLLAEAPVMERSGILADRIQFTSLFGEVRMAQRRNAEADSLFGWAWRTADSLGSAQLAIPAGQEYVRYRLVAKQPAAAEALSRDLLARYGERMTTTNRLELACGLASAHLAQDRAAAAVAALQEPLAAAGRAPGITRQRLASAEALMAQALAGRDPNAALEHLSRAARLWEAARAAVRAPEYREMQSLQGDLAVLTANLWLSRVRAGTDAQRTVRAFEAVQRYKGRTLLERGASIRGIEPGRAGWSFSLPEFQRSGLRPGEVLLDYELSFDGGYLFVVTPGGIAAHPLPGNDSLRVLVTRFRDLQRDPRSSAALRLESSREISRVLLGPAAAALSAGSRVLVSPSGALGALPFAVLLGPAGVPLADTHELANTPSAAWLMAERRRPGPASARLSVVARTTDDQGRAYEGVLGEARWLQRQFGGVNSCVHDGDRTLDQVLAVMRTGSVLHVASHMQANAENPWDSAMLLGAGNDEAAWLTAQRIARVDLSARLCVLAGCSSDVRSPSMGENINGLSSAFLAAGASSVVATLWAVDDAVAEAWTRAFYSELARGATVAGAARRSSAVLRAERATSHPSQWAAFVVVGDPGLRPKLPPHPSLLPGLLR